MTQDDERDSRDRRRQILDGALRVFSTKGFKSTTNKDIAAAAGGISPGLIYHYFKDKEDLFMAIVAERAPIIQIAEHPERLMELPPRQGLAMIGGAYLSMMEHSETLAIFRILVSEAIRFPQIGEMMYKLAIVRIFAMLRAYLELQVALGRLRPHDTGLATRSFIGMFIAHIITRDILRQPEARAISDADVVSGAVDFFLNGLALPDAPASS